MLWINSALSLAQYQVCEIKQRLDTAGFENIRAYPYGNTLTVSYENNRYRNKATAMNKVLDILAGCGYDTLKVITLVNDQPVIVTLLRSHDWQLYKTGQITAPETARQFNVSYNTDASWKTLRDTMPVNPHINKIDLVFYPQIFLMNVLFDRNYEVQLNIAPALEVSLWRGMKFTGQVIFPVVNDHMYGEEGDQVRAGFVTLAQEFRLPGTIQGRAVIGKFNAGRYGADMSLTRYFFRGQCYLSANAGYTGTYMYYGNRWYSNDLNTFTWFVKSGYYFKPYNVQLEVTAGRYINGDYGIRGDCTRYWSETTIGFYVMVAGGNFNGGFHFAIPLCPKQYKKNRYFQLRTPYYFDWEYNAGTEFYYGQYYETRPNENRIEYFYNPDLLTKTILK
ncbi:MAG: YjbH domain-containing protein [Bacteroidales bacterium]|jgi:hypothetical protein|nr:YjbH domain-containing protein [Bacteroidales bacterium]